MSGEISAEPCRRCGYRHVIDAFKPGDQVRTRETHGTGHVRIAAGALGVVQEWSQRNGPVYVRVEFEGQRGPSDDRPVRENFDPCQLEHAVGRTDPRWMVAARLADHLYRGIGKMRIGKQSEPCDASGIGEVAWTLRILFPAALDVRLDEGTWEDEMVQTAELLSVRFAERSQEIQKRNGVAVTLPQAAMVRKCDACLAEREEACIPLHDGERDPGLWVHPIRKIEFDETSGKGVPRRAEWEGVISRLGSPTHTWHSQDGDGTPSDQILRDVLLAQTGGRVRMLASVQHWHELSNWRGVALVDSSTVRPALDGETIIGHCVGIENATAPAGFVFVDIQIPRRDGARRDGVRSSPPQPPWCARCDASFDGDGEHAQARGTDVCRACSLARARDMLGLGEHS